MQPISQSFPLVLAFTILPCLSAAALPKEPDYPCYMRTTAGQVIDLTPSLCGGKSNNQLPVASAATPNASTPIASAKSKIEFAGIEFSYPLTITGELNVKAPLVARGQITNRTSSTITVATITTQQGSNLVQVNANTQVKPGQSATFENAGTRGRPTTGTVDDVVSWADLFNVAYTDGFAGCQFISNVSESEKRCKYH